MKISGWGNYPKYNCTEFSPKNEDELKSFIKRLDITIARGNGRSYGECSLNINGTINTKLLNKIIKKKKKTGELVLESGVLLKDIISQFLPLGWFPSVTPGTKFVTVGGMIAADIHGKNHHNSGSFGNFVNWIEVVKSNCEISRCSKLNEYDLFASTIGGMGLTGIILRTSIQLMKIETGQIKQKIISTKDLNHTMEIFDKNPNATYSVAWVDTSAKKLSSGRSIVYLGEHAKLHDLPISKQKNPFLIKSKLKISLFFNLPSFLVNRLTIKIFNKIYFFLKKNNKKEKLIDWNSYFYPLDSLLGWNKIYGRKGFLQYQCVFPLRNSSKGIQEILLAIKKSNQESFLTVLKKFGKQDSFFSFPMEGYTLSLDFPVSKKSFKLLIIFDKILIKYGGRIYLAKDSRISEKNFKKSELRVNNFIKMRKNTGSLKKFKSIQSERLKI